jgi:hypothetical protein
MEEIDYNMEDVIGDKDFVLKKKLERNKNLCRILLAANKMIEENAGTVQNYELARKLALDPSMTFRYLGFLVSCGLLKKHECPDNSICYVPCKEERSGNLVPVIRDYVPIALKTLGIKPKLK